MTLPTLNYPVFTTNLISDEKKTVEYRPFLSKESKILMMIKDSTPDEIIKGVKKIIQACTFDKIDVDSLPHFDITNLFLKIRSKSIGENVDVVIKCNCGNDVKSSMNLDELKVIKNESHSNSINLDGRYYLKMKYPNIEQALKLIDCEDSYVDELIIELIEALYDSESYWAKDDKSNEEWKEWLDNLQINQTKKITDFFKTAPNIKQHIEAKCSKCGNNMKYDIVGLYNFFV